MTSVLWVNNLSGGINSRTPNLLANDESELLLNISQQQLGNWALRRGSEKYLNTIALSNPIRGLGEYRKDTGATYLHAVHDGTLYVNGSSSWTSQDATEWAATSEIDMVNFINRHYFASSTATENIKYAIETGNVTTPAVMSTTATTASTGSTLVVNTVNFFTANMVGMTIYNTTDTASRTITGYTNGTTVTVNSSIDDTWDNDAIALYLDGKYLAVNGAYMMVSGNSVFPRRTYYSNVDSGNFSLGTDFFITSEPPTGLASFGNGRPFVIFTNNDYMRVDPAQPQYTEETKGFGCTSHRSIQTVQGNVIFLNQDGFWLLGTNSSYPVDISASLKNDVTGNAIINEIYKGNLTVAASGQKDNRYFCAVRDLNNNFQGYTLDACVLEYDLSQNSWKVHDYPLSKTGSVFASFTDDEGLNLYAGSFQNGTVYRLDVKDLYTDDDVDGYGNEYSGIIRTKHYTFYDKSTQIISPKSIKRLHFQYYAESPITIRYSYDGAEYYLNIKPNGEELPTYTDTRWSFDSVDTGDLECKTISLEIECSGKFIIYSIGFEISSEGDTGIKGQ